MLCGGITSLPIILALLLLGAGSAAIAATHKGITMLTSTNSYSHVSFPAVIDYIYLDMQTRSPLPQPFEVTEWGPFAPSFNEQAHTEVDGKRWVADPYVMEIHETIRYSWMSLEDYSIACEDI